MAIDIGSAVIDRVSTADWSLATYIAEENPANANGSIDTVEIWCPSTQEMVNTEVATFEEVSTDTFTTRDSEVLGTVTAGSKQTFSGLDMDVETGDYIGVHFTDGQIERENSGAGYWFSGGTDYIPCTNQGFSHQGSRTISLGGTGTESGGATPQAVGGGSIAIGGTLNRNIFIGVGGGSIAIAGSLASVLKFIQTVGGGSISIVGALVAVKVTSIIRLWKVIWE